MVTRWIAIFCISLVMTTGVQASKRVALVIGNSDYEHVSALPNPINDATDIAASFTRLGFDVTLVENLGFGETRRALGEFSDKAFGADMAVIFYAGHGMEVNKRNYLIPTDAELATDRAISYEALPMDLLTEALLGVKGLKLIMLDACRNNPFAAEMKMTSSTRSIGRGLAKVEPADGTLISFAAKEGTVAIDGEGRNSPYTKALLDHLEQAGLEIQFLFRKVRDQVMADTGNQQQPFTYGSLPGTAIYLFQKPVTANITINQNPPENDTVAKLEQRLAELQRRMDEAENRFSDGAAASEAQGPIAARTNPGTTGTDWENPQLTREDLFDKGQEAYDKRQYAMALRSWQVAAALGHPNAQNSLGIMYDNGYGVQQNHAEAANWYQKAAEQGYAFGQSNLGFMYENGDGVDQDYAEAVKWYRKAADQGLALGQNNLGHMYEKGFGVSQDQTEAVKWYRKAAEQGLALGQNNLGHMYENGYGVDRDIAEAVNWYRKAAEQGQARGQTNLGSLYRDGLGVEQNNAIAVSWYKKAAEQGFAPGQNSLGYMYANGYGVEKDDIEAVKWYRKAAEQENPSANHNLGLHYDRGNGVKKEPQIAAQYVLKALKAGNRYSIGQMKNNSWTWSKSFRKELQRHLKDAGYYHGELDGSFGPATKAAIDAFAKSSPNG